jgi:hypothetical protein
MSLQTLQAELRTFVERRDALALRLEQLRAYESQADAARDESEKAAEAAQRAYAVALGDVATGERADAEAARRAKEEAVSTFDERTLACGAIVSRIQEAERKVDDARRAAATRRERFAVALASHIELELRAAAKVFDDVRLKYVRAAVAAMEARHDATGAVGEEPVTLSGSRSLLNEIATPIAVASIRGFGERELLGFEFEEEAPLTPRARVAE